MASPAAAAGSGSSPGSSPAPAAGEAQGDEALRREIERLTRELDQTSSEKIQSAQYGLVLLEEKERLETRCTELEAAFENARHELQVGSDQKTPFLIDRGLAYKFDFFKKYFEH